MRASACNVPKARCCTLIWTQIMCASVCACTIRTHNTSVRMCVRYMHASVCVKVRAIFIREGQLLRYFTRIGYRGMNGPFCHGHSVSVYQIKKIKKKGQSLYLSLQWAARSAWILNTRPFYHGHIISNKVGTVPDIFHCNAMGYIRNLLYSKRSLRRYD